MTPTDLLLVSVLICQLDSPHFGTRQAAETALHTLGERAAPALELHSGSEDPELRLRVGRLLDARRPALVERLAARHPELRIDALPWNYHGRHGIICDLLSGVDWPMTMSDEGGDGGDWCFRQATHGLIVALLYNGRSYAAVAALLDEMALRQAQHYDAGTQIWRDD